MGQQQDIIDRRARTLRIRQAAEALGFDLVQITTAEPLPQAQAAIKERIALGFFDGMSWFTAERAEVSSNPQALLPQARSVIALGTFYLTDAPRDLTRPGDPHGQISCYAWGEDYHEVIRQRLERLAGELRTIAAEASAENDLRLFVDTGRMVDRAIAARSGLGWFGKNTNILTRQWGSWIFLAEIVTSLDLEPDAPLAASCGHCQVCLEACPDWGICSSGCARCPALHQLSDHRAPGGHPARTASTDWQLDLWVRCLPAGMPGESGRGTQVARARRAGRR